MTRKRTSYQMALNALRPLGCKATKTQHTNLKNDTSLRRWIAIPIDAESSTLTVDMVRATNNNLTALVDELQNGPHARARACVNESTSEDETDSETSSETSSVDSTSSVDAAVRALIESTRAQATVTEEQIQIAVDKALENAKAPRPVKLEIPDIGDVDCSNEHESFATLVSELALGHSTMLVGPAGTGKTTACERAAEKLGKRYHIQPPVSDKFELLGFVDANGTYQSTPAYRWVRDPGSVLIFDEIDRCEPRALCAMHTFLANGCAVFPHEQVSIPKENLICATANTFGIGPNAEYTGSARLDAATLNRFPTRIYWDIDESLERSIVTAQGGDMVAYGRCQQIRVRIEHSKIRIVWSPRDVIALCRRVAAGMTFDDAANLSVLATLPKDKREELTR